MDMGNFLTQAIGDHYSQSKTGTKILRIYNSPVEEADTEFDDDEIDSQIVIDLKGESGERRFYIDYSSNEAYITSDLWEERVSVSIHSEPSGPL